MERRKEEEEEEEKREEVGHGRRRDNQAFLIHFDITGGC